MNSTAYWTKLALGKVDKFLVVFSPHDTLISCSSKYALP